MPKLSQQELEEELVEQEMLEEELRYGTSDTKLLAKRKADEAVQDAAIWQAIRECREEMEREYDEPVSDPEIDLIAAEDEANEHNDQINYGHPWDDFMED